jgi:DNA-binding response OmpR family regulator
MRAQTKKILFIDDDELALTIVKDFLEKKGYIVHTTTNAIGAQYALKEFSPDMVLLDIYLTGSPCGDKLCRYIRGEKSNVRIILYSVLEEDRLSRISKECDADGYVHKSKDLNPLLSEIERQFSMKGTENEAGDSSSV